MRLTPARLIERIETRHGSLAATERLAAIVNGWASLEHLANRDNRMPGGFNDWEVVQDSGFSRRPAIKQLRSFVARPAIVTALHGVRVAASVVLILPVRNPVLRGVVGASSATAGVLLAPLHQNGGDGSDQVGTFTQALTAAARLSRSDRVTDVILWATSAQTTLAYLASGWVKLLGKPWREGTAIKGVMRTRTYGAEPLFRILQKHPELGRLAEVGTLVIECAYPIVYALNGKARLVYLGGVAALHTGIAVVMGLGRFLPAFLSLQPPVLYTATKNPGRDNTFPRVLAGATAIAAAGMGATQAVISRRARRLRGRQQTFTTSRSAQLAVAYRPSRNRQSPLLVFENSLVAVQEYWQPILSKLEIDAATLTYDRPGYGASIPAPGSRSLESHAADLDDLIRNFSQDREVWLIGHSLGGYLIRKAAPQLTTKIAGLILLDPTTATMTSTEDAEADREAMSSLTEGFPLMELSLRGGGALLLNPQVWSIPADPAASHRVSSVYRDHRIWRAGREEWDAAVREIINERVDQATTVAPLEVPTLVITASTSVSLHPVSADTHRALAAQVPEGRHLVVRATHDGMLTDPRSVPAVAAEIDRFIATPSATHADRLPGAGSREVA